MGTALRAFVETLGDVAMHSWGATARFLTLVFALIGAGYLARLLLGL